jgi:choline kinase
MQAVGSAVIAAAGLGSRIGLGMPKCMIELGGATLLTRLLHAIRPHVSVIHVVVGYREEMVIDYCAKNHPDVVLVRNPDYRSTNTAFSFAKGARHLQGKVVYLDGDLIVSPASLSKFFGAAKDKDVLVGVTDSKSENAVFIEGRNTGGDVEILGFSRENRTPLEWANIVAGPSDLLSEARGFVFERLKERLPLSGCMLDLAEIDTADDMTAAVQYVRQLDAGGAAARK